MEKNDLRARMRGRRSLIPDAQRTTAARVLAQNIFSHVLTSSHHLNCVCVYLSVGRELQTRYITRKLSCDHVPLCVPVWQESRQKYALAAFEPTMTLEPGKFGVREPHPVKLVDSYTISAFIIPGLAFDCNGVRIGQGGGYYDRILAEANPNAIKIGVGYDWQLFDKPLGTPEPHDIAMDWVVTDLRTVCCHPTSPAFHLP